MKRCRICRSEISPFISFGRMPIANGFLLPEQFAEEYFFELKTAFCEKCSMVQLTEQPPPQKMFHSSYAFFSGTSIRMALHCKEFASHVSRDYLAGVPDPFVVEVGSNDGIMLKNFAAAGIRHLGIEPSANVAKVAVDSGVKTICRFFNEQTAKDIVGEYGRADAFLGANVMCHISDLESVIAGIKILLKPNGIVMFEDPYLGDVIEKTAYDQIYDEHVFLFSASSIRYAFQRYGMELTALEPQKTHGGSMRYVISNKGARAVSPDVGLRMKAEKEMGLDKVETYERFRKNCERSREDLLAMLKKIKNSGKRITGYAATSKSTTVLNYCGIDAGTIEFISDTTPIKQGKFSPGMHIPVRAYDEFINRYPDYAVLFAWNHEAEIMAKEEEFRSHGGRFIAYVPEVHIK